MVTVFLGLLFLAGVEPRMRAVFCDQMSNPVGFAFFSPRYSREFSAKWVFDIRSFPSMLVTDIREGITASSWDFESQGRR